MARGIYIPKRYILTIFAHLGFVVVYALVALVAMVNSTYANVKPSMDPECSNGKNETVDVNVSLL